MFDNETGSNARTPASTAPAPVPDVRRWAPASAMPTATERMRHGPLFPILVGGLAGAILGLGLALVQPRVYEAGTRVSLPPVASEAPKGKTDPRIEALRERVLTDDVLRRVVSQLGLASDKDLAGAPDGLSGSAEIARAAEALRRRVAVLPAGADQADIRVRFGEGAKAARIADALAATIVANPPMTAPMPAPIPAPSSAPVAAAPGASVARNAVAPSTPAATAPIAAARSGPALPPDAAVVALLEQRLAQASEARRAAEAALRAAREDGRAEALAQAGTDIVAGVDASRRGSIRETPSKERLRVRYEAVVGDAAIARVRADEAQATLEAARRALDGLDANPQSAPAELQTLALHLSGLARLQARFGADPVAAAEIERLRRVALLETRRWAQGAANALGESRAQLARAEAELERLRGSVDPLRTASVAPAPARGSAEQNLAIAIAVETALSEALHRPVNRVQPPAPAPAPSALLPARRADGSDAETARTGFLARIAAFLPWTGGPTLAYAQTAGQRAGKPAAAPTSAPSTPAPAPAPVLPPVLLPPVALAIVAPARVPSNPIHPPVVLIVTAATLAGLALGAFVASRD